MRLNTRHYTLMFSSHFNHILAFCPFRAPVARSSNRSAMFQPSVLLTLAVFILCNSPQIVQASSTLMVTYGQSELNRDFKKSKVV